ncbi:hypothetical protein K1719_003269 [Acacia pycnantha]|nr:hypothetical protein K1719_003269 [Acacia pycnantha]
MWYVCMDGACMDARADLAPPRYASFANLTGLCQSPQLQVADLSYNFFEGGIPACLEYLPRSSFQGNCFQSKELKQRSPVQCGTQNRRWRSKRPPSPTATERIDRSVCDCRVRLSDPG